MVQRSCLPNIIDQESKSLKSGVIQRSLPYMISNQSTMQCKSMCGGFMVVCRAKYYPISILQVDNNTSQKGFVVFSVQCID